MADLQDIYNQLTGLTALVQLFIGLLVGVGIAYLFYRILKDMSI